jgi:molybdate transport system ATP-binding protein
VAHEAGRTLAELVIDVDIHARSGTFELSATFRADAPIVGLFGRSGAGKTTVVNAIAGIVRPTRGLIRVDDVVLYDSARGIDVAPERRRIGYVFQDALLFPHLTVESNLLYGQGRRRPSERFIGEKRVVDLLGLAPLLARKPATLSGGEKQRVAIGRALLAQPRILLMDEPLASLDVPRRSEILDYIELLRDELAIPIVYVTHSVGEIARLADTVVILSEGKCLAVGDIEDVMGRLDLKPATGRYEAGALLDTKVAGHDLEHELTKLGFEGGELWVPHLEGLVGERIRVRIRSRDVSLALRKPDGISILNVLHGTIASIRDEAGPIVEVQVATGAAHVNARITRRSLQELGIHVGQEVYALVKAVSLDKRAVGLA